MSHSTDPWDLAPPALAVRHSPIVQLAALSPLAALAALDPAAAVVAVSRHYDAFNPALNPAAAVDLFAAGWVVATIHGPARAGAAPAPVPPGPRAGWYQEVAALLPAVGPVRHHVPGARTSGGALLRARIL